LDPSHWLKDSAFYLGGEKAETVSGGGLLESSLSPEAIERRCADILAACDRVLPFAAARQNIPLLVGLPPLDSLEQEEQRVLVSGLDACLSNSEYSYSREGSIGRVSDPELVLDLCSSSVLIWIRILNTDPSTDQGVQKRFFKS